MIGCLTFAAAEELQQERMSTAFHDIRHRGTDVEEQARTLTRVVAAAAIAANVWLAVIELWRLVIAIAAGDVRGFADVRNTLIALVAVSALALSLHLRHVVYGLEIARRV